MNVRGFARVSSIAVGALRVAAPGLSQAQQPTSGKVGSMEWTLVSGRGNADGGPGAFPGGGGGGRGAGRGAAGAAAPVALLLQVAVAVAEDSPAAVAVVAAQPVSSVAPRKQRRSVPA